MQPWPIPHPTPCVPTPTCINLGLAALLPVKARVLLATSAAVVVSRTPVCLDRAMKGSGQVTALWFLTGGALKCSKAGPVAGLAQEGTDLGGKTLRPPWPHSSFSFLNLMAAWMMVPQVGSICHFLLFLIFSNMPGSNPTSHPRSLCFVGTPGHPRFWEWPNPGTL